MNTSSEYQQAIKQAKQKHQELFEQRSRVAAIAEENRLKSIKLGREFSEREKSYAGVEKSYIKGDASPEQLADSKEKLNVLREELREAEHLHQLAASTLNEIDQELLAAFREIQAAHTNFCFSEKRRIAEEPGQDKKIREKLMASYAAMCTSNGVHDRTWSKFLAEVFSQPGKDEVTRAADAFLTSNNLDEM